MIIAFCYFASFCFIWWFYGKKAKWSVGFLLLSFYTLSALLTFLESFSGSPNYDTLDILATIYYLLCVIVSLIPFLILGKYDCQSFIISHRIIKFISIFLIVFGLIDLVQSSVKLISNIDVLTGNIGQFRMNYYDTIRDEVTYHSIIDKIIILMKYFQYMSPFCCFYYITKKENRMVWLLFFASLSFPIHNMVIGEREAVLKFLANYAFCYLFFKSAMPYNTKRIVLRAGIIALAPLALFVAAMTIARAIMSGVSTQENIFAYGGDMPYFFSRIFNDPYISDQALGGRMCFRYFFPIRERMQSQLNDYINADYYLNQFAGLPGSFFFDFGFYSIMYISAFSVLYLLIIKGARKTNTKYPFYLLVLLYSSFQVCFMNIFYYDYIEPYVFFLALVLLIYCFVTEKIVAK